MDNERGEIMVYQSEDGLTRVDVKFDGETVWLTQQQMADLFQSSRSNVVEHIHNIYEEGELEESSTCRKFRQVRTEGYFDFAEISAIEHRPMYMADYIRQLDSILSSGGRELLKGPGEVSHEAAIEKAHAEYRKYQQKTLSPVEEAYLQSLKDTAKKVSKRRGRDPRFPV